MSTIKQQVIELIKALPEDCTIEDIHYHLYVREKVKHGLRDAGEGRVYTQEEVEKRMAQWLAK